MSWHGCRYGAPKFWMRNDAEGTWDISEGWPPALPAPGPAAPAAAPAAADDSAAADSDSGSCLPDIDETLFCEVLFAPHNLAPRLLAWSTHNLHTERTLQVWRCSFVRCGEER